MSHYARFIDDKGNDELGSDSVMELTDKQVKSPLYRSAIEAVRSQRYRLRYVKPNYRRFEIRRTVGNLNKYANYTVLYSGE